MPRYHNQLQTRCGRDREVNELFAFRSYDDGSGDDVPEPIVQVLRQICRGNGSHRNLELFRLGFELLVQVDFQLVCGIRGHASWPPLVVEESCFAVDHKQAQDAMLLQFGPVAGPAIEAGGKLEGVLGAGAF